MAAATTYHYLVYADRGTVSSLPSNEAQATTLTAQQPPAGTVMHVASLQGSSAANGKSGWRATVTITVRDDQNQAVANATVVGSWGGGSSGSASCVTGATGTCGVTSAKLANTTSSVTFTVSTITRPNSTYDASKNAFSSTTVAK